MHAARWPGLAVASIAALLPRAAGQATWHNVRPGAVIHHAAAWDAARARTVFFDSISGEAPEWDGTSWYLASAPGPSIRYGAGLAYDAARGVTVMFGGGAGYTTYDETWEWNGSQWRLLAPAVKPPLRSDHGMVYDSARGVVVVWGGGVIAGGSGYRDTWEWDGVTWRDRTPATSPPRGDAAMAYDAARRRTVLHTAGETWEWDGVTWQKVATSVTPGNLAGHELAYDTRRARTVLFGGYSFTAGRYSQDTWEWDGSRWTQRLSNHRPPARVYFAMAYDGARGCFVLHGGYERSPHSGAFDDLWEWDGADWTERRAPGPQPQGSMGVAFDPVRERAILFLGYDSGSPLTQQAETWEWDGENWQRLRPATTPTARDGFSLAADTTHRQIVRFGGYSFPWPTYSDETWLWNGTDWSLATPANRPAARRSSALAHDPDRGRTVLFGGETATGLDNSTWEWDGSDWHAVNPPVSPPPRRYAALGYHAATDRTILFGGYTNPFGQAINDTWSFDGSTWQQLFPVSSPPAESGRMVEDAARGRLVYLGSSGDTWEWTGVDWDSRSTERYQLWPGALAYDRKRERVVRVAEYHWRSARTWEWFSPFQAHYAPFGQGCAGTLGVPALSSAGGGRPWLGDLLQIELSGIPAGSAGALITGSSNTTWGGAALPYDLTPFGLIGCRLFVSTQVLVPAPAYGNTARWLLAIPASSTLLGAELFQQGLVADPQANPAGLTVSNGVQAVLGAR